MKKLFEFEDKIKHWIENKRGQWFMTLFILGIGLGLFFNHLTGNTQFKIPLYFGSILIITEFFAGGSGID